jgi:hypothetical protein
MKPSAINYQCPKERGKSPSTKNYKRRVESSTMILLMSKDRGKPFNKKR